MIVDRLYGEHDLGVRPDPGSFDKLIRALWIEFGDIYDRLSDRFLRTNRGDRLKLTTMLPREIVKLEERYLLYIPDDVLTLATLHHILDVLTYCLLNIPINMSNPKLLFNCVRVKLKHYVEKLKEFRTSFGKTFDEVFYWLINVLEERSQQIIALLTAYLESKGIKPGLGPDTLTWLLKYYVESKDYYGIVCVSGKPLPLVAASRRIYSLLSKGERIRIGFSYRSLNPCIYQREIIEASSLEELYERLGKEG